LASIRLGDVVAIKLLFADPARDRDGRIDVTYDLRVIAPDGAWRPQGRSFRQAAGVSSITARRSLR
jgi:hypothetical protein